MKRIFIAVKVYPDDALADMISSFMEGLENESIKWVNTENIHITLAFPGNTEDGKILIIDSMLREKCSGLGSFDMIIRGAGIFKSIHDPRVIWAGIERSEKLSHLNEIISQGLNEAGIKIEDRPFRPHLTLGRIRHLTSGEVLNGLIEKYHNSIIQKSHIDNVILYESILLKTGPVYKPLGKYIL